MKAITLLIPLLFLLIVCPHGSFSQSPGVKTDRGLYAPGDTITVQFDGLPGSETDWITIVKASEPDTAYGQWSYTKGSISGTMTFRAGNAGRYEARLYFDHPAGGKVVRARSSFQVGSGETAAETSIASRTSESPSNADSLARTAPQPKPVSLTPNPLNVKVRPSVGISSTMTIAADGGVVAVTGKDNTRFTLRIPKNALVAEQQITLTPVESIDGIPFSGPMAGAVQMRPEGLRFISPATLTIESRNAKQTAGMQLAGFAYHGGGDEFHLYPSELGENKLTLSIWHFSGVGASGATSSELNAQKQRIPTDPEDAINQRMAEYLLNERVKQLMGSGEADPNLPETMAGFMKEYYDLIKKDLTKATTDCDAAQTMMPKALGWVRWVNLLGAEKRFSNESDLIMETFREAIQNCYDTEYEACLSGGAAIEHHRSMLGYLRQATLLGIELDESKLDNCPPALTSAYTGSITYTEIVEDGRTVSRTVKGGYGPGSFETITDASDTRRILRASINVNSGQDGKAKGTLTAFANDRTSSSITWSDTVIHCHVKGQKLPRITSGARTKRNGTNLTGTTRADVNVSISANLIEFYIPKFETAGEASDSMTSNPCGDDEEANGTAYQRSTAASGSVSGKQVSIRIPSTSLRSPDHLQGEKTETLGTTTIRYTWNLVRRKP
jgi:hypothetical protein